MHPRQRLLPDQRSLVGYSIFRIGVYLVRPRS